MNIATFHFRDVLVARYDADSRVFEFGKDAMTCCWSKSDLAMFTSWLMSVTSHMNGFSLTGDVVPSYQCF